MKYPVGMIIREINAELTHLLGEYPVVTLLGPRQSGKTTLAQSLPNYAYCNLEIPENREFANHDPKAFLKQFKDCVLVNCNLINSSFVL